MSSFSKKLTRRSFLKVTGLAGGLAGLMGWVGYDTLKSVAGEPIPELSPYDDTNTSSPKTGIRILVVSGARTDNPFALYIKEILTAEGFAGFRHLEAEKVTPEILEANDLVLLANTSYTDQEGQQFLAYVLQGGKLILMRPDQTMRSLFGIGQIDGQRANGYIKLDSGYPRGKDVFEEEVQYHGEADCFKLEDWETFAWLAEKPDSSIWFPAVAAKSFGGGRVILWAYDLASSILLTRQGNPAWTNEDRDGREGIRAVDAFIGWVDLDRVPIPQADVQMRLLSRIATDLLEDQYPLPRLWYFPDGVQTVLVATGDSHQSPTWAIEEVLSTVEKYGGTMSVYYSPPPSTSLLKRAIRKLRIGLFRLPVIGEELESNYYHPTSDQVTRWRERGHEFALHPYVDDGLEAGWKQYWNEFTGLGFGPVSPTVRTHKILWTGWVESARVQATFGMQLNVDYYHYGPAMQKDSGEWVYGYFTGSGLPMRFMDEEGRFLDIFQQLTQLVDEHLIKMPWGLGGSNIGGRAGAQVARKLIDQSQQSFPSVICGQFHIDPIAMGGEIADEEKIFIEGTLEYAKSKGIPIISASNWLKFINQRINSQITDVQLLKEEMRLVIEVLSPENSLWKTPLLVPAKEEKFKLKSIDVNGEQIDSTRMSLSGVDYYFINLPPGTATLNFHYTEIIDHS